MQDLLLELGFEELPARFIEQALKQLSEAITAKLTQERLAFGQVSQFGTPRRLAVLVEQLQEQQEDLVEEVKGPPLNLARDEQGNWTKAGLGFLRSQGADEKDVLIKSIQGADYMFIRKEVRGQKTSALLKPLLEEVIANLSFPKNMRWGDYDLRYARPLRWIVALFGSEVIPLEVGPLTAGQITFGHRQLSSGPVVIEAPTAYAASLEKHYVIVDAQERRSAIWQQIQDLARSRGANVQEDERLLKEVTNLVEYPTAFQGHFSEEYLAVPAEVLITSMKEHQRYFPLHDAAGKLKASFIGVRNGADNHLGLVIKGNEKVLAARLSDAKFFYEEDLKTRLVDHLPKLEQVVFQERLGSMGDKVRRLERLTGTLAELLGHAEHKQTALRTARLAKCDLVTQMVYEFPELQGIMGEKYALAQGEEPAVAAGIREHYLPRFAGDVLPETVEGTLVSLADKLDNLVGYFAVGKIPTGSQDPFALRRQAQGVVQILRRAGYDLALSELISAAAAGYSELSWEEATGRALVEFLLARLRVILLEQDYSYDTIDAVLAGDDERIPSLERKVRALAEFREEEIFADLITGFERVANLAAKGRGAQLEPSALQPADVQFQQALQEAEQDCLPLASEGNYRGLLHRLAEFRARVDLFFEQVMIMDEDPTVRGNRLALLNQALDLYGLCGDLHLVVVNK
ncbi:MAG: glycine--tRNA ligase subunit beta [Limnochordia bacterium]